MRYSRVQKTCASCGATMFVKRCVAKRAKYCSRACLGRATVRSKTANRKHPVSNSGWFTNEGSRGALNANWVECVNLRCEQCGEQFGLKPYEIRRRTIHCGYAPRFCSVKCHIAHKKTQTGPASPYWRGRNRQYRGPGWRTLRLNIINKQHGFCAHCSTFSGTSLHVHHVEPFRNATSIIEANRNDNLIGFCRPCHGLADYRPERFRKFNAERQRDSQP